MIFTHRTMRRVYERKRKIERIARERFENK